MSQFNKHTQNYIEGIIVTVFEDFGPSIAFNESVVSESEAFNLSIKLMTTLGQAEPNEMYGPLSVPEAPTHRALAFMFLVKSQESKDQRIREFGRHVMIILIFKKENKWAVIQASGLLKSYLTLLTKELEWDSDLTFERLKNVYDKIILLVSSMSIRVYRIGEDSIKIEELLDGRDVPLSRILLLVNLDKDEMNVLMQQRPSPMDRQKINNEIDALNKKEYQFRLKKKIIDEPEEIRDVLKRYRIDQIQAPVSITAGSEREFNIKINPEMKEKISKLLRIPEFRRKYKYYSVNHFCEKATQTLIDKLTGEFEELKNL